MPSRLIKRQNKLPDTSSKKLNPTQQLIVGELEKYRKALTQNPNAVSKEAFVKGIQATVRATNFSADADYEAAAAKAFERFASQFKPRPHIEGLDA